MGSPEIRKTRKAGVIMTNRFEEERAWWQSRSKKEKAYVVYFIVSCAMLMTACCGVVWMAAVVLNFCNAAEKVKGVSLDGLEDR